MRILVTGSRDLSDQLMVWDALVTNLKREPSSLVVGDCPTGADRFAREAWTRVDAIQVGVAGPLDVHVADWTTHGKSAGPLRNRAMVDSGADLCLAFYKQGAGNRGTKDCVRRAKIAGIPVIEHTEVTP